MNAEEIHDVVERMEATRCDMIEAMAENEIEPNEVLSLLSGMLIQFYCELVEDPSRDNFVNTLTQCFDAYTLLHAEPKGSVQ